MNWRTAIALFDLLALIATQFQFAAQGHRADNRLKHEAQARAVALKETTRRQAAVLANFSTKQAAIICNQIKTDRRILRGVVLTLPDSASRSRSLRQLEQIKCPPPVQPPPIP